MSSWAVFLSVVVVGCDGYQDYQKGIYRDDGAECSSNTQCISGICQQRVCVPTCMSDNDCPGSELCNLRPAIDLGTCTDPCTEDPGDGVLCIAGLPTPCSQLGDEYCESCGCAAGSACVTEPKPACIQLTEVGLECDADSDCASGNCSAYAGVCRVSVGDSCTPQDCDRCLEGEEASYCSRACGDETLRWGDADAGTSCGDTGSCEVRETDDGRVSECTPSCEACPTDCVDDVCTCEGDACSVSREGASLGQRCAQQDDCGGRCLLRVSDCSGDADPVCTQQGLCSKRCMADDECQEDGHCSADGFCLPACDLATTNPDGLRTGETCPGGACVAVASMDGTSRMLCEPRGMLGAECVADVQCVSGTCADGRCAEASAAP